MQWSVLVQGLLSKLITATGLEKQYIVTIERTGGWTSKEREIGGGLDDVSQFTVATKLKAMRELNGKELLQMYVVHMLVHMLVHVLVLRSNRDSSSNHKPV